MKAKHPDRPEDRRDFPSIDAYALQATEAEAKKCIASFSSGPRSQHLEEAISLNEGETGNKLLTTLTIFTNFFLSGLLPIFVGPVFSSATLISLWKKDGGVRPIAIGKTLRRLAGKSASKIMTKRFSFFGHV